MGKTEQTNIKQTKNNKIAKLAKLATNTNASTNKWQNCNKNVKKLMQRKLKQQDKKQKLIRYLLVRILFLVKKKNLTCTVQIFMTRLFL